MLFKIRGLMKKLTTIISLFASAPAFAGALWAQTPFWQAPVNSSYKLKLLNTNAELNEDCQYFKKNIWSNSGKLLVRTADEFQINNKLSLPSDYLNKNFQVDFRLDIGTDGILSPNFDGVDELVQKAKENDKLPYYTQKSTAIIPLLADKKWNDVIYSKNVGSMTEVAEQFKVKYADPILFQNNGYFLRVFDKALACDLLSQSVSIKTKINSVVKISLNEQMKMSQFYSSIDQESFHIVTMNKKPYIKAALLGYKIGDLYQKNISSNKTEDFLTEFIAKFFQEDTLEPNDKWKNSFDTKILDVTGSFNTGLDYIISVGGNL